MDSFDDYLTRWQPFFSTMAGVSATLAGLLFVSLSINQERITARENRVLMRLAQRSFGDFLYALFIALMFLQPKPGHRGLIIALSFLIVIRAWWLVRSIRNSAKSDLHGPGLPGAMREYAFQTMTLLGLIIVGVEVYLDNRAALFLLVPITSFLLYNASRTAWALLIMERKAEEKPRTKNDQ